MGHHRFTGRRGAVSSSSSSSVSESCLHEIQLDQISDLWALTFASLTRSPRTLMIQLVIFTQGQDNNLRNIQYALNSCCIS